MSGGIEVAVLPRKVSTWSVGAGLFLFAAVGEDRNLMSLTFVLEIRRESLSLLSLFLLDAWGTAGFFWWSVQKESKV